MIRVFFVVYPRFPRHLCIGNYSRIKTGMIRVLSIGNPNFAPFSDIFLGHKIFLHGRISALLQ